MDEKNYKGDYIKSKLKFKTEMKEIKQDQFGNFKEETTTQKFTGTNKEPNYIKIYLEDIELLFKLPTNTSDFLYELLKYMNYEGEITINSLMKERICKSLNLKNPKTINNYLTFLIEKDVMKRIGRGVYIINPYLLAKGKWEDIEGLRVTYKEDGKREVSPVYKEDFEELKEEKKGE